MPPLLRYNTLNSELQHSIPTLFCFRDPFNCLSLGVRSGCNLGKSIICHVYLLVDLNSKDDSFFTDARYVVFLSFSHRFNEKVNYPEYKEHSKVQI